MILRLITLNLLLSFFCAFVSSEEVNSEWSEDTLYKPWPSVITKDDYFYRGQATNLTSFQQMLDMLTTPNESSLVTSRLFRTLKKLNPNKTLLDLKPLVDKQLDGWRKERVIWQIVECHVDVYGCAMPSVKQLMGVIFKVEHLPAHILDVHDRQIEGGITYLNPSEMSAVLEFFDPVVSTSFYKDVADKFAKNKGKHIGYVMILNDRNNRNCQEKFKKEAIVLLTTRSTSKSLRYHFGVMCCQRSFLVFM